jgi:alpha-glucosidase
MNSANLLSSVVAKCRRHLVAWAALLLGLGFPIASAHADSLDVSVGKTSIHVIAISPTVFRLSVKGDGGPASPLRSLYLDPALQPGDVGKRAQVNNGHQQLKTDLGTLDVDPTTGTYSLFDPHGLVLIPSAPVAVLNTGDKPMLNLHIGWPDLQPFSIYSCGNGANGLIQHKILARVGNGIAVQPFFWAHAGYAAFVVGSDDNAPAQCDGKVDHGAVTWAVPGTSADLYLIIAPALGDGTRALLDLTGRPPVPPRWTFGYMQSRWGWTDRAYIDDALHQFQVRKLPVDAFIFDFEWYTTLPDYKLKPEGTADFSDFGFNAKLFPDPAAQIKQFHDAGIHIVGIRKPRLGNSGTLTMIRSKGWDYKGKSSSAVDSRGLLFSDPNLRAWYARQTQPLLQAGVDGWWNDEGEFTYTNYLLWNQAERAALDMAHPEARLWTINRAFDPGMSRLGAAAWTGDIHSTWPVLKRTPAALLNWSLAGEPYGACDIGGFRGEDTPELLTRWMQAGTFFPVMRTHSSLNSKPHFPWLFGDEAEAAMRKTLELRYRLIPILYSLAHQTQQTGEPIMRPLMMQYPNDVQVSDLTDEWLIGRDLLAAPVLNEGGHRDIYLPDDIWYDFATGQRQTGGKRFGKDCRLDEVPVYIRGGSILTLAPALQHTRHLPGGPLDVEVYTGRDGSFTMVEDDGSTTAYLSGNTRKTEFTWDDQHRTLAWTQSGSYAGSDCFRSIRITINSGGTKYLGERPLSPSGKVSLTN